MSLRKNIFVFVFILYFLVVQFGDARDHLDEEEDDSNDDEAYRLLKRFLWHKSTTVATQRPPSVIDNLVRPSSTRSPTEKPPIWTQKSTYSPVYPSSGACSSNPCEHGGICIAKGQMTSECQCVGPWRGIYCGVADACYRSPCQNGGICLNVYDDCWCKCPTDYYGTNCQSKFYSPSSSVNHCRPNICNSGQCVSLQTTYYCRCPNDRYGEHCEKRFSKRKASNLQSYYNFLHQIKRGMINQDERDMQKSHRGEDVAFYDVKNGIYFFKEKFLFTLIKF